jgi:hypothetical protein
MFKRAGARFRDPKWVHSSQLGWIAVNIFGAMEGSVIPFYKYVAKQVYFRFCGPGTVGDKRRSRAVIEPFPCNLTTHPWRNNASAARGQKDLSASRSFSPPFHYIENIDGYF